LLDVTESDAAAGGIKGIRVTANSIPAAETDFKDYFDLGN
jgi:hypothetical protein